MLTRVCLKTGKEFTIPELEESFCKRFGFSLPTLCPEERQKRRFAWRNERSLHARKCSATGKRIIAAYPEATPFPVYSYEAWWGESWDPLSFGQDFDFNQPFFPQFKELINKVPRLALSQSHNENCDYVNYTNYSKDSYLVFGSQAAEKCAYSWRVHDSLNCVDCSQLNDCELCFECVDCDKCYDVDFSQNCQNCNDSEYLYNCRGCKNCFLSCNLIHKEYCIFNEQYTSEEYQKKKKEYSALPVSQLVEKLKEFEMSLPHRALNMINCENCVGDYLIDCKNCENVFSAKECQDMANAFLMEKAKDCVSCNMSGWPAELCYEGISTAVNAFRNFFSSTCWTCSDIYYCDSCFNSSNLFGCTGLKKNQYCILNKQYDKASFDKLRMTLIEHMKKTQEYGEFFPIETSPFPYNETVAANYYPE